MLLLWTIGLILGYPTSGSLIAGTGFVLTSTAVVMQMLEERRQLNQPSGRRIVSILLLEDLAIVPLLALVAFLAILTGQTTPIVISGTAIGCTSTGTITATNKYLMP